MCSSKRDQPPHMNSVRLYTLVCRQVFSRPGLVMPVHTDDNVINARQQQRWFQVNLALDISESSVSTRNEETIMNITFS